MISRTSHFPLFSASEGNDCDMMGDEGQKQLAGSSSLFLPIGTTCSSEEPRSLSNDEWVKFGIDNLLTDADDAVTSSPKIEEVSHQGRPIVRGTLEEKTEHAAQHRWRFPFNRSRRSPTFFGYPMDVSLPYEGCCALSDTVSVLPGRVNKEEQLPDTGAKVDRTSIKSLEGAATIAVSSRQGCKGDVARMHIPSFPVSGAREVGGMTTDTPSSTQEPLAQQGARFFALASDAEGSLFLTPRPRCETTDFGDDSALCRAPALGRESALSPEAFVAFTPPSKSDLFHTRSSNVNNTLRVTHPVADNFNNPNTDSNRFSSHTDNYSVPNGQLNRLNMDCEWYRHSGGLRSCGGADEALEGFWHGRGPHIQPLPPIPRRTISSDSEIPGEDSHRPLLRDTLMDGNVFEEGFLILSSRPAHIPPFKKPVDVVPLLEKADRDLARATSRLVPVLAPPLTEEGEVEQIVGSSQDSHTLGSLSWLSSVVASDARRQHLQHGNDEGTEEALKTSLEEGKKGPTEGTSSEEN